MVTGIQRDELAATPDEARRLALLERFDVVNPATVLAASFALDIAGAGLDEACWNDGSGTADRMLTRLRELDSASKKRPRGQNQLRDILIAETAIKLGAVLFSGDANLCRVTEEFGGRTYNPKSDHPPPV